MNSLEEFFEEVNKILEIEEKKRNKRLANLIINNLFRLINEKKLSISDLCKDSKLTVPKIRLLDSMYNDEWFNKNIRDDLFEKIMLNPTICIRKYLIENVILKPDSYLLVKD